MTYSPLIPQAGDNPSDSQPLILANFTQLNTQFSVDHVPLTASSNNGKHDQVTWINQSAALPITATANELIAFGYTQSGITMPYYSRDTISTATTLFPLAPVKAYANVRVSAIGNVSIQDAFNFDPFTSTTIGVQSIIHCTLQNAMRTNLYGVVAMSSSTTGVCSAQVTNTTDFDVTVLAVTSGLTFPLFVTIICLET